MPVNFPNFLNAPLIQPDYSGFENLIPNFLEGYYGPKERAQQFERGKYQAESEKLKNALLKKYGEQEKQSKLKLEEAKAKAYATGDWHTLAQIAMLNAQRQNIPIGNLSPFGRETAAIHGYGTPEFKEKLGAHHDIEESVLEDKGLIGPKGGAISQGQRIINSLPANVKNEMSAQMTAWGIDPVEGFNIISAGGDMNQIKEIARNKGVDVENAPKIYAPTQANITAIKNLEGASKELGYLESKVSGPLARNARNLGGVSLRNLGNAVFGLNKDEQAQYLASRALQTEIAGARTRIAGGSNAHKALIQAQKDALGQSKIFQETISPEVFEKTQHYINKWLQEAFEARKKSVTNVKEDSLLKSEALEADLVTIKNEKTGETKTVTRDEARNMGALNE